MTEQTPGRRRRSEQKRAVILEAAESLFASEGFDRVSVDAIADRAGVSKRTVYDHFADKRALWERAYTRVADALARDVGEAIDQELVSGREIREALIGFAERVTTRTLPSNSYSTFRRLDEQASGVAFSGEEERKVPDRLLARRFSEMTAAGQLHADDAELAALQYSALTIRLVLNELRRDEDVGGAERHRLIAAGVDVFLSAYA
ncbi:TetR/AcrR family transcriptional regulator [Paramicrobacterium agarici]|nr:TetR/AcrR family transcriptional regulator [Microbacterium agarici]